MPRFLEKWPLYPFLIAIYPVLYLLSENKEEIGPEAGLRSALILLVISALIFVFSLILTRNPHKGGLVTLLVLLVFFLVFFVLYAPVYRGLREVAIAGNALGRHRYLVPATFILLILTAVTAAIFTRKINVNALHSITLTSNLVAIILVLIPVLTLISYQVKKQQTESKAQASLPAIAESLTPLPANAPDIYYIILDTHTSDNVLKKILNYDNNEFSDTLRENRFFVSECSQSNYSSTQLSITSSLNVDFIQNLADSNELSVLYPLLMSNMVGRSLVDAGYSIYAFESGYKFTDLTQSDQFLSPVSSAFDLLTYPGITPFESLVMQVSGGKILYESRSQLSKKMQYIIDASFVQYRERILFTLDTLPTLAREPGPKFVFAHILAPHDPFVFKEDGSYLIRRTPFTLTNDREYIGYDYFAAYVSELKYLQERVLRLVEEIIATSKTPPVIIIQGDHGLPRAAGEKAQFEILNAYYFGGDEDADFYDTISPVNTFRLVFNRYFGTNYPLLPDDSYMYDKAGKKYDLMTDSIACP